jgi:hypothetical protein
MQSAQLRLAAFTQKNSSDVIGWPVAHARHVWAMAQRGNGQRLVTLTNFLTKGIAPEKYASWRVFQYR